MRWSIPKRTLADWRRLLSLLDPDQSPSKADYALGSGFLVLDARESVSRFVGWVPQPVKASGGIRSSTGLWYHLNGVTAEGKPYSYVIVEDPQLSCFEQFPLMEVLPGGLSGDFVLVRRYSLQAVKDEVAEMSKVLSGSSA